MADLLKQCLQLLIRLHLIDPAAQLRRIAVAGRIPRRVFPDLTDPGVFAFKFKLHARMQLEFKGEYTGIREIRKHAAWYTSGYRNSSKLRGRINEVETYEQLEALFQEVCHFPIDKL